MAGIQKKAIVRLLDGGFVCGYLPPADFVESSSVIMMDVAGRIITFSLNDIRWIVYVRYFNSGDLADPEKVGRKSFLGRPRLEGLWVRMTFRDGDVLEGICGSEIGFLHEIVASGGLLCTPPDPRSNALRIYVPRTALTGLELLAVIGSAAKKKPVARPVQDRQPGLFGEG